MISTLYSQRKRLEKLWMLLKIHGGIYSLIHTRVVEWQYYSSLYCPIELGCFRVNLSALTPHGCFVIFFDSLDSDAV